jgi:squalene synthase HpnC
VHDDDPAVGALGSARADTSVRLLAEIAARSAAKMGGENFPVALRFLPAAARDGLERVYRYARFVDDVGDEGPPDPADRLALLDVVETELRAVWSGAASTLPPVRDLRLLIDTAAMPVQPFLDLVQANRLDQTVTQYAAFDDLMEYCRFSATPVGRIVLRLADADDAANIATSDAVCSALQVLEHCQDVGEDARAGRVYLPQDDLSREGVTALDLRQTTTPVGVRRAVAAQVLRADRMLAAGPSLVRALRGWPRFAVAGYLAGGEATSRALRAADYDVLARPVRAGKARTALLLARRVTGR